MDVKSFNSKIECRDLKKCGEIATLLSSEKPEFFLNCGFCDYTFLQLENFIRHIYEDHILEFSQLELKQEEDIKEFEEEEAVFQTENRDNSFVFKDFERVEIELDTRIDPCIEIKNATPNEFMDEELLDNTKTEESYDFDFFGKREEPRRPSDTTSNRQQTNKKKCDWSEMEDNTKTEEWDDSELLEQKSEPRRASETISNRPHTNKKKCDWNKTEQSNNNKNYEDSDLEDDYTEGPSKGGTQATSKSTIKNSTETTIPRSCLEDAQYELLADIYKNYTCLWDENEIAYRFKNRRDEALKTLHLEVNERAGLDLTKHEMEYEITRLRRFCSVEKKKKVLCKRKQQRYEPTCSFHKSIVYLEVDVPPFECSECGKLLPGLGQYKVHLASHDGSLPFKCHLCGHGFQLVSNLTVHLRRHVHDYIYKCEICDKPCATSTEIKIHMRSHTGEKPFICSICGQGSRTSSHLLVHMLRHQKRPRYQCKLCPKMFYETGTLHEHMAVHRNIRDQICSVCNKGFTSGKQLRQHQLIHNAEKKYSCKLCGKRFAQFAGLSGHMKSHGTKLATTVRGSNFFNSE
ncbi:PREDICTED: zinc finger protein 566-like isoform X4 [Rhagoletis zephyria]|uniref:zinc finger protein 566-like isoform X4 n=1 Tax=Rhagoletis zephyria TaxID=28612 RepID=UPI0008112B10|nr:PREDICTED: zinc finger protein 566-like isoform X4 [Rhagoletis zephyria]